MLFLCVLYAFSMRIGSLQAGSAGKEQGTYWGKVVFLIDINSFGGVCALAD